MKLKMKRPGDTFLFHYGYCLLLSGVLMAFFSCSSFLYPANTWEDTNVYMTMGRGMLHGAVPYRDLFDHKGLLWYFIYGFANLISERGYIGLYIVEVFSFSVFLYFSFKLLGLFCGKIYSLACLPFLGGLILTMDAFGKGGSIEEIHLAFASVGLYCLIRWIREPEEKNMGWGVLFGNGVLAGCVMWMKYSLLGFWFAWMASVFFLALSRKRFLGAVKACLVFLGGMAAPSVPCLLYLFITRSFSYFWETYIVMNLNYSGSASSMSLPERAANSFQFFSMMYSWNKLVSWLVYIGLAAALLFPLSRGNPFSAKGKTWPEDAPRPGLPSSRAKARQGRVWAFFQDLFCRLAVPFLFLVHISVAFMGVVSHFYYYLVTASYLVLFFLYAGTLLGLVPRPVIPSKSISRPLRRRGPAASQRTRRAAVCLLCAGTTGLALLYGVKVSPNVFLIGVKKEELPQYQAAALIDASEKEAPTLMYYRNQIDAGFLRASSKARPWGKYFYMPNISYEAYPEILDSQDAAIQSRAADFLVTWGEIPESVYQTYHLAQYYPGTKVTEDNTYLLLQPNSYDLYTTSKFAYMEDGSFCYSLGDIDWELCVGEDSCSFLGTLRGPATLEALTLTAPGSGEDRKKWTDTEVMISVSEDGKSWAELDCAAGGNNISAVFPRQEIKYIRLTPSERTRMDGGDWKLYLYEPSGWGQQKNNDSGPIRALGSDSGAESLWLMADHDITTGWNSQSPQARDMALHIGLDRAYRIAKIHFGAYHSQASFPYGLALDLGDADGNCQTVPYSSPEGCGGCVCPEETLSAQSISMTLTREDTECWEIDELEIFVFPEESP